MNECHWPVFYSSWAPQRFQQHRPQWAATTNIMIAKLHTELLEIPDKKMTTWEKLSEKSNNNKKYVDIYEFFLDQVQHCPPPLPHPKAGIISDIFPIANLERNAGLFPEKWMTSAALGPAIYPSGSTQWNEISPLSISFLFFPNVCYSSFSGETLLYGCWFHPKVQQQQKMQQNVKRRKCQFDDNTTVTARWCWL